MDKIDHIELKHFTPEYIDKLHTFKLPEEQAKFTSLPSNYMEVATGQFRVVILCGNDPVGFFLLHNTNRVNDYTDNPKAMLLTSLSINHNQQGKGYAKKAMSYLDKFVATEFPTCNEIVLAVNHKNTPAQDLYVKVGFQDTGRRKIGAIGEQFILSKRLK
ncbi:GNAT family N-acetyltransferase [Ornithinibacillus xuwenensis]|uniref:GNAT family N-acetyltransferase n=1 Tax=Ornithinibacillus xuwenensis TaxID=3144668 RepID=A0ABU9XDG1_9BACI